jgi:hypothetical protein
MVKAKSPTILGLVVTGLTIMFVAGGHILSSLTGGVSDGFECYSH